MTNTLIIGLGRFMLLYKQILVFRNLNIDPIVGNKKSGQCLLLQ